MITTCFECGSAEWIKNKALKFLFFLSSALDNDESNYVKDNNSSL